MNQSGAEPGLDPVPGRSSLPSRAEPGLDPVPGRSSLPRRAEPGLDPVPGRSSLPSRAVTAANIEDAYMAFIFYCNPSLPADCDTASLREAFRNPPRSGGKVFDPFTIYGLVRKFYDKTIRTWTELTTKLGVEPPDPAKEESVQKIAQYGVRLKKWLHSMHVKAFFEYLMGVENDYWKKVPTDPNPLAVPVRDGIAVEDDMVFRALLPHIRLKRGRKRPWSEEGSKSTPQRQRISPTSAVDDFASQSAWSGDDARSGPVDAAPVSAAGAWPLHEGLHTPLNRWPASAVTPSAEYAFWGDEPRSAVTPSKAKASYQRRGAKNVSSAWKLSGDEPTKKTRGRPPINRTPLDTPITATSAWPPMPNSLPVPPSQQRTRESTWESYPTRNPSQQQQQQQSIHSASDPSRHAQVYSPRSAENERDDRPARPSISLQVPQRIGAQVRLATPPGWKQTTSASQPTHGTRTQDNQAAAEGELPTYDNIHALPCAKDGRDKSQKWEPPSTGGDGLASNSEETDKNIPQFFFETMKDRTNVDALMAYFIRVTHESHWYDDEGNPTEAASMEEAAAIINSTLENMYRTASSSQAFLINLAALAGARMLMTNITRCIRVGEKEDHTAYRCEWEYRFGNLQGYFNMAAAVPFSMWRARRRGGSSGESEGSGSGSGSGSGEARLSSASAQARHWQNKYKMLLGHVDKVDKELFELRNKVIESLKPGRDEGVLGGDE